MKKASYIYLASLFLGFHLYLIIYINSSFLLQFVDNHRLDLLYIAGAVLNIILFLIIPRALKKIQIRKLTTFILATEFFVVYGLSKTTDPIIAQTLFIIQQGIGILIIYCLDLFLESTLPNEKKTGRVRSYFLMSFNTALIISLGIMSFAISGDRFDRVYAISATMLIPIFIILITKLHEYRHEREIITLRSSIRLLKKDRDIIRILFSNITLQFFYVLMVIYLPIHLRQTIGFSWQEIGFILMIMILPFLIFQIPAGRIIDKKTGEKEFLFIGFIIMSIACFTIPFLREQNFWLWALILFFSRIGAALVEISNESYFFKKVDEHHPGLVSIFRMTGSAAYILAPAIAIPILRMTDYSGIFILLGFTCLLGLLFIPKVDTR